MTVTVEGARLIARLRRRQMLEETVACVIVGAVLTVMGVVVYANADKIVAAWLAFSTVAGR